MEDKASVISKNQFVSCQIKFKVTEAMTEESKGGNIQ